MPLLTVLCNPNKLDTQFKLQRPLALSSYRVLSDEIFFMGKEELEKQKTQPNEQIPTYLNVSITLDPAIHLPYDNSTDYINGAENHDLL